MWGRRYHQGWSCRPSMWGSCQLPDFRWQVPPASCITFDFRLARNTISFIIPKACQAIVEERDHHLPHLFRKMGNYWGGLQTGGSSSCYESSITRMGFWAIWTAHRTQSEFLECTSNIQDYTTNFYFYCIPAHSASGVIIVWRNGSIKI